ncbi:hypothetical protein BT96DRAFT_207020 [Gymnopus androsaceus JB14]|uniref:Uncharacterized protein n=1 Tax=Gymnopus androsaceus JB14 TaxID=1447944 RepID=A0A6A4I9S6_9AGAR|nr:hypothetical protein BT96DRAFT_207020 [Gymnopus androsaceus JB14]
MYFVAQTGDPAEWILVNVFFNGTAQIGGTFSGSGSTTKSFTLGGPHFLQALATNNGSLSLPFYTGNLFIPVDPSDPTSAPSLVNCYTDIAVNVRPDTYGLSISATCCLNHTLQCNLFNACNSHKVQRPRNHCRHNYWCTWIYNGPDLLFAVVHTAKEV